MDANTKILLNNYFACAPDVALGDIIEALLAGAGGGGGISQTVLKLSLTLQGQAVPAVLTKTGNIVNLITDSFDVASWSGINLGDAQIPVGYRPDASNSTASLVSTVDASGTVGTVGQFIALSNGDMTFYKNAAGDNPVVGTEYNFFGGINATWTIDSFT